MTDYTLESTIHVMFTTRAFATGIPTALLGTPVVAAYEDASTTQITAGITLGVSHDSVAGLNLLTIAATAANGYENGKDYHLVITAGTVDSVSVVGEVVGRFTIGRSAAAVDLANGTDGLGAIKTDTAAILVDTGTTLQAEVDAIQAAVITNAAGVDIAADIIALKAVADAVLTDTAEIGAAGAGLTAVASAADLATVAGFLDTEIAAILEDTAEIGIAGAGLTAINLPDQTMNITGNITGDLSGSVGSVTGAVGSVTGNVGGNVTGSVGSLATQAKADVNAEVVDVVNVDTFAEPGQGAPAATASLAAKIGYLFKAWRNKIETTATEIKVYNDDGTTVGQKSTISDDATTFSRGEFGTGA